MRRHALAQLGLVVLGLIGVVLFAASATSPTVARGGFAVSTTMATPDGAAATHCLSVMVQNTAHLSPEMQRKAAEFSATHGKPVSFEGVGQRLCFATAGELQTYLEQHDIKDTATP